jgi:PPM family protein phosphatase
VLKFIKKIFGRNQKTAQKALDNVVTAPLSEAQLQSIRSIQVNHFEPPQLLVTSAQSVGRQRELNEDSLFTISTTIAGHSSNAPFGLFIIADGMGGHQYGEVASNTAMRVISGYILKKFHNSLFNIPSMPVGRILAGNYVRRCCGSPTRHSKRSARQRDDGHRRARPRASS